MYVDFTLISGCMLGIEYVEDLEFNNVVIDLFVVRILVSWG